jgi:hypothetical protein
MSQNTFNLIVHYGDNFPSLLYWILGSLNFKNILYVRSTDREGTIVTEQQVDVVTSLSTKLINKGYVWCYDFIGKKYHFKLNRKKWII